MKPLLFRINILIIYLALIAGHFAFSQAQEFDTSAIENALSDSGTPTTAPAPPIIPVDSPGTSIGVDLDSDDYEDEQQQSLVWLVIKSGGTLGVVIFLLSIVVGALVIEHLVTVRRSTMIPQELADRLFQIVKTGDRAKALELCKANPGFLSNVITPAMLQPWSHWEYVEKAVEDALADQAGRLYRKVDWLSLIGSIAPMVGLLGTVVGMIVAFRNLSLSDGMVGAHLAEGIYLALITTAEGLLVAIPAMMLHSLFTNRITSLVGDVAYTVEQILRPIKFAVKPSAEQKN